MEESKYYPLALEALVELAPEIAAARELPEVVSDDRPSMKSILQRFENLPAGALFLGIADDGLPVLLNLFDPSPGPMLIIAEQGAGKTALLQSTTIALTGLYESEDVQFSAITSCVEDWNDLKHLPHCVGIFPFNFIETRELIASLYDWSHQNVNTQHAVLIFVDGLDQINSWDDATKSQMRWLLMRGPSHRVWPILTLNASLISDTKEWLSLFRTMIYGRVENTALANMLTGASRANLENLRPGVEFKMKEGNQWLRFWIPKL